ncbi:MAG TPA: hypothetical protein VLA37_02055, partial [Sphingomonadaceae bacterium]|nr:hypothetical protein [Sphingomonadaceae bacterium]
SICLAYAGDGRESTRELDRALSREIAPRIDVLLAQRYAGAATEGGRSVTIEWDEAEWITPFRYSLASALGMAVPDSLEDVDGEIDWYRRFDALSPAKSLAERAAGAEIAGTEGVLSGRAMVDLYSQIYADDNVTGEPRELSIALREAYVAQSGPDRLDAMRTIWGPDAAYGRLVLTAYAAARVDPSEDLADEAGLLIASMLSAGLDRNAMRWGRVVSTGSTGWALLALAQPSRDGTVSSGGIDSFIDDDDSAGQRKSRFLVAGLAGLGRIDSGTASSYSNRFGLNLGRESDWSRIIARAAEVNNPALVAMLAGLGMQGSGWDKMTARNLYYIVRSLNQVGLSAEARMIAAEAVARG